MRTLKRKLRQLRDIAVRVIKVGSLTVIALLAVTYAGYFTLNGPIKDAKTLTYTQDKIVDILPKKDAITLYIEAKAQSQKEDLAQEERLLREAIAKNNEMLRARENYMEYHAKYSDAMDDFSVHFDLLNNMDLGGVYNRIAPAMGVENIDDVVARQ